MYSRMRQLAVSAAFLGCIGFVGSGSVFADAVDGPDGPFELEGDVAQNFSNPGPFDDWANVNGSGATQPGFVDATGVVADGSSALNMDNIPTGGSSKDIFDFDEWRIKTRSVGPKKDNLANAYGAFYSVDGELHFYFGYDRADDGGTATNGIWLTQNDINVAGNGLEGVHEDGDTLIVIDFSQGGSNPIFVVYQWDADANGGEGDLVEVTLAGLNQGLCSPTGDHDICAITNADGAITNVSWVDGNQLPQFRFVEGGVNLTKLFGGNEQVPCFTDALIEARASNSENSVLKDIIVNTGGDTIDLCTIAVDKACLQDLAQVLPDGQSYKFFWNITVENTGFGTLYDVLVTDLSTRFEIEIPELAPGASETFQTMLETTANPAVNTASAAAAIEDGGERTVTDMSAPEPCSIPVDSGIDVTKHCDTDFGPDGVGLVVIDGQIVVRVQVEGQITNTGIDALQNITLSDDPAFETESITDSNGDPVANLSSVILAPGDHLNYVGSYTPSEVDSSNPELAVFPDTVTATGVGFLSGEQEQASAMENCELCPGN